jgi:hypothetical protein
LRESIAVAADVTPVADPFGTESQDGKEAAEVTRRGVLVRVSPETRRALKLAAIPTYEANSHHHPSPISLGG